MDALKRMEITSCLFSIRCPNLQTRFHLHAARDSIYKLIAAKTSKAVFFSPSATSGNQDCRKPILIGAILKKVLSNINSMPIGVLSCHLDC